MKRLGVTGPWPLGFHAIPRCGQRIGLNVPTIAIASSACLLAGCMNLSGLDSNPRYGCRAPEGVHCQSVSGTYANTATRVAAIKPEQTSLTTKRSHVSDSRVAAMEPLGLPAGRSPAIASTATTPSTSASTTTIIPSLRSAPRILRLWFKPWEDNDRDLYDEGYVFVQVDNGQWLIEHAQQRIRSAYAPVRPPAQSNKDASTRPMSAPASGTPVPVPPSPSTSGLFGNKPVFPSRPGNPLMVDPE